MGEAGDQAGDLADGHHRAGQGWREKGEGPMDANLRDQADQAALGVFGAGHGGRMMGRRKGETRGGSEAAAAQAGAGAGESRRMDPSSRRRAPGQRLLPALGGVGQPACNRIRKRASTLVRG